MGKYNVARALTKGYKGHVREVYLYVQQKTSPPFLKATFAGSVNIQRTEIHHRDIFWNAMPMRTPRILIQVHIPAENRTQLRKMLRKIFHNQNDIQLGQNSSKFQVVEIVWVISSTGESEV